jgi:hypothetical protein
MCLHMNWAMESGICEFHHLPKSLLLPRTRYRYRYQLLTELEQAKSHCFASHRTTHGLQQQISFDPLPLNILITEIYSIYIKGLLFERRSRSGQQVRRSIRLVLGGGSFGPTDPPDETASKGRPSCLPNSAALIMAPPIKQENPPPLEDCRLLRKNAVDQAEGLSEFHDAMALVVFWDNLSVLRNLDPSWASPAGRRFP